MKNIFYSLLFIFVFNFSVKAQETISDSINKATSVNTKLNSQPEPPGGMEEFYARLSKKLKNYRPSKKGKMKVKFIVNKDGSISDVTIVKGLDEKTNKKILKLISKSANWTPGYQNGVAVKSQYYFPITFN